MIKRIFSSAHATLAATAMLVSTTAGAAIVEIDAAYGNTDVDVQAALDAHLPGTTFILKGTFNFFETVFIEKSGTSILGEWVDDGDGIATPGDTWNTVIDGNSFVAFEILPGVGSPKAGKISDISISGIRFSNGRVFPNGFRVGNAIRGFAIGTDNSVGCEDEKHIFNVSVSQNYFEGSGVFFAGNVDHTTIEKSFFGRLNGESYINPITLFGSSSPECDVQLKKLAQGNSITDNIFDSRSNVYSGFNIGLRISGNRMFGPTGSEPQKITLFEQQDALVSDNFIAGQFSGSAIEIFSRNVESGPGNFSSFLTIKNNELVNWVTGIFVYGPLRHSKVNGNYIHRVLQGIVLVDNASPKNPVLVGQSDDVEVKNNHFEEFLVTGILVNADTSGIRMVNNSFDGASIYGDVLLAPLDVIWWSPGMCPASGNTIIGNQLTTEVVTFGVPVCEGDDPNRLLGNASLLAVPFP